MATERMVTRLHAQDLTSLGWVMLEMPPDITYSDLHVALIDPDVPGSFGIITDLVFTEGSEWFTLKTVWFSDPNAAFEFKLKYY
jgi:hypothetical protein